MKASPVRIRFTRSCSPWLLGSLFLFAGCKDNGSEHAKVDSSPSTIEAACQDGEDNDADGLVDCDDSDCQSPGGECKAAPELDRTVATTLFEAAQYLYTGDNPLQKEVKADTIDRRQVALLRGRVIDADGAPLAGVKLTVKGHSEYGYTYSRGDGYFDMAVNGGARLVLNFESASHLSLQRAVYPGWQRYVSVPDAGMTEASTKSTPVNSDSERAQVVEGEAVEDDHGAHTPLIVMEPGTSAKAILDDGGSQALDQFSVSITEYPITAEQEYLPSSTEPSGGLAYGLEFGVKEADALGAEHVAFSQSVSVYVEDIAELDTGTKLTVQHYDRGSAQWEAGVSGSVIEILDVEDGVATVDSDGDGDADDTAKLEEQGITESDLKELAKRFDAGQKLWHGELRHFSLDRLEVKGVPPVGAEAPLRRGLITKTLDTPTYADGVVIETQASTHDEPIVGTPFSLHYQSNRTYSYGAGRMLELPLVGDTVPSGLLAINAKIAVAGRTYEARYSAKAKTIEPNLRYSVNWDGTYSGGTVVQGQQVANVEIQYVYPDAIHKNLTATISNHFDVPLGGWDARAFKLGGFSIDAFHAYDPAQQIVYFGHGGQRTGSNVSLVTKRASNDESFSLGTPDSLVVASDGSLIITDDEYNRDQYGRVLRIAPDGTPSVLFGKGASGDAADVLMSQPQGVGVLSDGRIVVVDIADERLVELSPDGKVRVLVSGDDKDKPVVKQKLEAPMSLALGPHEEIYFVDVDKVYRYEAGHLEVLAGGGENLDDNIDARSAKIVRAGGVVVAKDGSVYVSDCGLENEEGGHRVRRISSSGIITTVAGTKVPGFSGDDDVATKAQLSSPHGLALDEEGQLYIVDQGNHRIRRISPDGMIQTVIGGGASEVENVTLAANVKLDTPDGIAIGPDGAIYVATVGTVLRVGSGLPHVSGSDSLVPSVDGRTLYRFDSRGKHRETIDAVTGVTELTFKYDKADELLEGIVDKNGNTTTIRRKSDGTPEAIVAKHRQETKLLVEQAESGDVTKITDPLDRTTIITWTEGKNGLIQHVDDPKEKAKTYRYDATARAYRVTDATGYARTLARTESPNGWSVAVTAEGDSKRTTEYLTQNRLDTWTHTVTFPDGKKKVKTRTPATITKNFVDGSKQEVILAPDVFFGSQVLKPYATAITLPSGKTLINYDFENKKPGADNNPLAFSSWENQYVVGDSESYSEYVPGEHTWTFGSPTGRLRTVTVDDLGRPIRVSGTGFPTYEYTYDLGRPKTVTATANGKTRHQTYDYDKNGWLEYFTDALNQKTEYGHDLGGRLTQLVAPDQAKTYWQPDNADNVKTLIVPGHPEYKFEYDEASKLLKTVTPPAVDGFANAGVITFAYGKENEVKTITHADHNSIGFTYNQWGQLTTQKLGKATLSYNYTRGQLTRVNRSDSAALSMTYDGPLWTGSTWSVGVDGKVTATYNDRLWLSSLTVNDASTVNYTYDLEGDIIAAKHFGGTVTLTRDPNTGVITNTAIGDTTSELSYSDFVELEHESVAFSGENLFEESIAQRDDLGRIRQFTETVQGTSHDVAYDYDLGGRLKTVTRDGVKTTYDYDPNGNRTSVQVGTADAIVSSFDEQDRILNQGDVTYEETDHGDLSRITDGSKRTALTYDELGNLMKVAITDNGTAIATVEYQVDGLGRRISRRINGSFDKKWLYRDSLRPEAEVNAAGVFTHYVYASNDPNSGAPIALIRAGVLYRVVKDHLGSVRMVVNAQTGDVAQSIDYDAWGNVLSETGAGFQPFGFAGGLYDATTKLVRFGARDYDPATGRWTAKDVIGFAGQQGNLYVYVNGDPVNFVDVTGREPMTLTAVAVTVGTSALIGAVIGGGSYFFGTDSSRRTTAGFLANVTAGAIAGAGMPLVAIGATVGSAGFFVGAAGAFITGVAGSAIMQGGGVVDYNKAIAHGALNVLGGTLGEGLSCAARDGGLGLINESALSGGLSSVTSSVTKRFFDGVYDELE